MGALFPLSSSPWIFFLFFSLFSLVLLPVAAQPIVAFNISSANNPQGLHVLDKTQPGFKLILSNCYDGVIVATQYKYSFYSSQNQLISSGVCTTTYGNNCFQYYPIDLSYKYILATCNNLVTPVSNYTLFWANGIASYSITNVPSIVWGNWRNLTITVAGTAAAGAPLGTIYLGIYANYFYPSVPSIITTSCILSPHPSLAYTSTCDALEKFTVYPGQFAHYPFFISNDLQYMISSPQQAIFNTLTTVLPVQNTLTVSFLKSQSIPNTVARALVTITPLNSTDSPVTLTGSLQIYQSSTSITAGTAGASLTQLVDIPLSSTYFNIQPGINTAYVKILNDAALASTVSTFTFFATAAAPNITATANATFITITVAGVGSCAAAANAASTAGQVIYTIYSSPLGVFPPVAVDSGSCAVSLGSAPCVTVISTARAIVKNYLIARAHCSVPGYSSVESSPAIISFPRADNFFVLANPSFEAIPVYSTALLSNFNRYQTYSFSDNPGLFLGWNVISSPSLAFIWNSFQGNYLDQVRVYNVSVDGSYQERPESNCSPELNNCFQGLYINCQFNTVELMSDYVNSPLYLNKAVPVQVSFQIIASGYPISSYQSDIEVALARPQISGGRSTVDLRTNDISQLTYLGLFHAQDPFAAADRWSKATFSGCSTISGPQALYVKFSNWWIGSSYYPTIDAFNTTILTDPTLCDSQSLLISFDKVANSSLVKPATPLWLNISLTGLNKLADGGKILIYADTSPSYDQSKLVATIPVNTTGNSPQQTNNYRSISGKTVKYAYYFSNQFWVGLNYITAVYVSPSIQYSSATAPLYSVISYPVAPTIYNYPYWNVNYSAVDLNNGGTITIADSGQCAAAVGTTPWFNYTIYDSNAQPVLKGACKYISSYCSIVIASVINNITHHDWRFLRARCDSPLAEVSDYYFIGAGGFSLAQYYGYKPTISFTPTFQNFTELAKVQSTYTITLQDDQVHSCGLAGGSVQYWYYRVYNAAGGLITSSLCYSSVSDIPSCTTAPITAASSASAQWYSIECYCVFGSAAPVSNRYIIGHNAGSVAVTISSSSSSSSTALHKSSSSSSSSALSSSSPSSLLSSSSSSSPHNSSAPPQDLNTSSSPIYTGIPFMAGVAGGGGLLLLLSLALIFKFCKNKKRTAAPSNWASI
jgi:hypothetical protein